MEEYTFTWMSALKILGGVLLFAAWLLAREQTALDKQHKKDCEEAKQNRKPIPARRFISRSNVMIVVGAILLVVIVMALGNKSTI